MDIEALERFALAEDRDAALEGLLPGSEDYYYYACLAAQQRGDGAAVRALLERWARQGKRSARLEAMLDREALRTWELAESQRHLRTRLQLHFDHQPERSAREARNPSRLDRAAVLSTLEAHALEQPDLGRFTDRALPRLARGERSIGELRALLGRLQLPDLPDLDALVIKELRAPQSRGFGWAAVHKRLLPDQLEALRSALPELDQDATFVDAWVASRRPERLEDDAALEAWLEVLWGYIGGLAAAFNSLKLAVLQSWLRLDLRRGQPDAGRLRAYLSLPQRSTWIDEARIRSLSGGAFARAGQSFPSTGLPPAGADDALIRELLSPLLVAAGSARSWLGLLDKAWLDRVFAEAMAMAGRGDPESLAVALGGAAAWQALRERTALTLAPTNPERWSVDAPVVLEVDVKNVPTLTIRIFEIDAFEHLRATGREPASDMDLDGLVPGREITLPLDAPPIRRIRKKIPIEGLEKPGVFAVEILGGGTSCRALIRKGGLRALHQSDAEGHLFTILDESGAVCRGAELWMDGRRYSPRAEHAPAIRVPFSQRSGGQPLILRAGDRAAALGAPDLAERYALRGGIHVPREQLLRGGVARAAIHAQLELNGAVIDPRLLEDVTLTIASEDRAGGSASRTDAIRLTQGLAASASFPVPDGLSTLTLTLKARVPRLSADGYEDLQLHRSYTINQIERTEAALDAHLARSGGGYTLWVLGKNGEPVAARAVQIELRHKDYTHFWKRTLQSDDAGRIALGDLTGFSRISASGEGLPLRDWRLSACGEQRVGPIDAVAGAPIPVPWSGGLEGASLLRFVGERPVADLRERLRPVPGGIEIAGLPAGDYALSLPGEAASLIRVGEGAQMGDWLVGDRDLRPSPQPVMLAPPTIEGDALVLRVSGQGARVHVFAQRFLPERSAWEDLQSGRGGGAAAPGRWSSPPRSEYLSGREIGDEYRYILDRRGAERIPGSLLRRPGLLLNPWERGESQTHIQPARPPMAFAAGAAPPSPSPARRRAKSMAPGGPQRSPVEGYSALDFLRRPARSWLNLEPNAEGEIRLPASQLAGYGHVRAVVIRGSEGAWAELGLPEAPLETRDLRLRHGLDPSEHRIEQRQVTPLLPGESTVIAGSAPTIYASLEQAFSLLQDQSGARGLDRFRFLLGWPGLGEAEKRARYSEHACHELSLFLSKKDPAFFARVVLPHLRNKARRTFIDALLLGEDLTPWLDPWAQGRLNAAERALLAQALPEHRAAIAAALEDEARVGEGDDDEALDRGARQMMMGNALAGEGALDDLAPPEGFWAADEAEEAEPEPMAPPPGEAAPTSSRGARAPRLYRGPGPARELAEQDYRALRPAEQGPALVPARRFWSDLARHGEGPFLSRYFTQASGSFTEVMLALAVLDLPFGGAAPSLGEGGRLEASAPLIVAHRAMVPVEPDPARPPVLVSQGLLQADDQTRMEGGQAVEKYVSGPLSPGVVYVCKVVLTNPTAAQLKLQVLLQIPEGALPVSNGQETEIRWATLSSYSTQSLEYRFYFPSPGTFRHYPAHAARRGALIAWAAPAPLEVIDAPPAADTGSWRWVSQRAPLDGVLAYLAGHNPAELELGALAWRMREPAAFEAICRALESRRRYDEALWSYALLHGDRDRSRRYLLESRADWLKRLGPWIGGPLDLPEPEALCAYEHLEYAPLLHARVHPLGARLQIQNDQLASQLQRFWTQLAHKACPAPLDWLAAAVYLLAQDRIQDGEAALERVPATLEGPGEMQAAYLRAWVALRRGDEAGARALAEPWLDAPVDRWRRLFEGVIALLDDAPLPGAEDDAQAHTDQAREAPSLSMELAGDALQLRYRGIGRCEVRVYEMDIELLFSRQPFVQRQGGRSFVAPNHREEIPLPEGGARSWTLPERYRRSNAVIEVAEGALRASAVRLAHALDVHVANDFGQLRVNARGGGPLAGVYVKVYSRERGGQVVFFKDGYTDLRGRFDYASLNTDALDRSERLAILVLDDERGAVVREVAPPAR